MRVKNSKLNCDLFRHNLVEDPGCLCGSPVENAIHFLLECPLYSSIRTDLHDAIHGIFGRPNLDLYDLQNRDKIEICNLLICGNDDLTLENNVIIAHSTQTFIIKSGRFS